MRFYLQFFWIISLWLFSEVVQAQISIGPDSTILKEGQPYRGVGVNYFNCFERTLSNGDDKSYESGFAILAEKRIPFVRFCCCGYWPVEMKMFRDRPDEYFRRLDGVIDCAERHGIGLIPSLFWNFACVPDLVGEPINQWANSQSQTQQFMRKYVQAVVTRYHDRSNIWAWELGNEFALEASLPNAREHRAAIVPERGTPDRRSERDELTFEMVHSLYVSFGKTVRQHDSKRLLITGDAIPRPAAWHLRKSHSWQRDTSVQFREMLDYLTPDPINIISIHAYTDDSFRRLPDAMRASKETKKPLFVGEFGVPGATPESTEKCREKLKLILDLKVPLAALWVFDYERQRELNVTATNARHEQLEMIARANQMLRGEFRQGQ